MALIYYDGNDREEMEDVVASIFDLMGRTGEPMAEDELISERVDRIFKVTRFSCYGRDIPT